MQAMTGQTAVESAPSSPLKEESEFALEIVAEPSGEALLRVLNPLQKLAIAPRSVRAETSATGIEMIIELQVDAHNHDVFQPGAKRRCYLSSCARCKASGPFRSHDVRQRGLRIVVNHTVVCCDVWLVRWRCRKCRAVFTDYPPFRTSLQTLRMSNTSRTI